MAMPKKKIKVSLLGHLVDSARITIYVEEISYRRMPHTMRLFKSVGMKVIPKSKEMIAAMFKFPKSNKLTRLMMPYRPKMLFPDSIKGTETENAKEKDSDSGKESDGSDTDDSDTDDDDTDDSDMTSDEEYKKNTQWSKFSMQAIENMRKWLLVCHPGQIGNFNSGDVFWGFDESKTWHREFLHRSLINYLSNNWERLVPHKVKYCNVTVYAPYVGKTNEYIRNAAASLGYDVRVLPLMRLLKEFIKDNERIVAFVNSNDQAMSVQIEEANEEIKSQERVMYYFDMNSRMWSTDDGREPYLLPQTTTVMVAFDGNYGEDVDMTVEAIRFLFECRARDSLAVQAFQKENVDISRMTIELDTRSYEMEEKIRRTSFDIFGSQIQFSTISDRFYPSTEPVEIPSRKVQAILGDDSIDRIVFGNYEEGKVTAFYDILFKKFERHDVERLFFQNNSTNSLYYYDRNGQRRTPSPGKMSIEDHLCDSLKLVGLRTDEDVRCLSAQLGSFMSYNFFYFQKRKRKVDGVSPSVAPSRSPSKAHKKKATQKGPTSNASILRWFGKRNTTTRESPAK